MKNILVALVINVLLLSINSFACDDIACLSIAKDHLQSEFQLNLKEQRVSSMLLLEDIQPDSDSLSQLKVSIDDSHHSLDERDEIDEQIFIAEKAFRTMEEAYILGFIRGPNLPLNKKNLGVSSKPKK